MMMRQTPRTFVGVTTFQVVGMTGPDHAREVAAAVSRLPGAVVSADPGTGRVVVTAERPLDRADVVAALEDCGLSLAR